MKSRNITLGIIVLGIGVLFLLQNFGWLSINWWAFFKLWPILLILIGISIIKIPNKYKAIALIITFILSVCSYLYLDKGRTNRYWKYHKSCKSSNNKEKYNDNETYLLEADDYSTEDKEKTFHLELDSITERVDFEIFIAATQLNISATDENKLLCITSQEGIDDYKFSSIGNINKELKLSLPADRNINIVNQKITDKYDLKLNTTPVWSLDISTGAGEVNLDASSLKIKDIYFRGGAFNTSLKIGKLQKEVNLKIDSAASDIEIFIPEDALCEIKASDFLNINSLDGFKKINNKYIKTPKEEPSCKIFISYSGTVNAFKVETY